MLQHVLHLSLHAGNEVHGMNTGIVLHESFDCKVYDNYIHDTEYGVRLVVGAGNNRVYENDFKGITEGELNKRSIARKLDLNVLASALPVS